MKAEEREDGINLIPENQFETKILKKLKSEVIAKSSFEDAWEQKGKLIITFDYDWGK